MHLVHPQALQSSCSHAPMELQCLPGDAHAIPAVLGEATLHTSEVTQERSLPVNICFALFVFYVESMLILYVCCIFFVPFFLFRLLLRHPSCATLFFCRAFKGVACHRVQQPARFNSLTSRQHLQTANETTSSCNFRVRQQPHQPASQTFAVRTWKRDLYPLAVQGIAASLNS